MSEIDLEVSIEIPVAIPFKKIQKDNLIDDLTKNFKNQTTSIALKDTYYIEKRSAESGDIFKTIFDITVTSVNIGVALLWMLNLILKMNPKNIITVKKKNGKDVRLFDGMTEEEIMKALEG